MEINDLRDSFQHKPFCDLMLFPTILTAALNDLSPLSFSSSFQIRESCTKVNFFFLGMLKSNKGRLWLCCYEHIMYQTMPFFSIYCGESHLALLFYLARQETTKSRNSTYFVRALILIFRNSLKCCIWKSKKLIGFWLWEANHKYLRELRSRGKHTFGVGWCLQQEERQNATCYLNTGMWLLSALHWFCMVWIHQL